MTQVRPTILHVDMDAFYASVETRDNPSLAGLPVCVGGPSDQRGVIAAASYEARRYGVHSAMSTAEARRLCPDLVLLPPDFERYTSASRDIMAIFRSYTPLVEPLSLDEAFLDVAGCERLFGDAADVGRAIQREILHRTGLPASVGVAPTKFLAKLASDLAKPQGFRIIEAHETRAVLDPLPVSRIWGVGPRTAKRLEALGVATIGDLAQRSRDEVVREFGASGAWIHDLAHGIDTRRVTPRREEKSHGMERTFAADVSDRDELRRHLLDFCEEVAFGLRDKGLRGRTVTLKARYSDFTTLTRTKTLDHPTNLGPRIYSTARELLDRLPIAPLRLIGVQISALTDVRAPIQESLFGDPDGTPKLLRGGQVPTRAKLERAAEGMDKLRRKFGARAVVPASLLGRTRARGRDGSDGQPGVAGRAPEPGP
ncbi:MAG: DNA polymerase IV [Planctomycetota bacterium]|nr:DNA polymerase IV [Planctomycetota bacterium]